MQDELPHEHRDRDRQEDRGTDVAKEFACFNSGHSADGTADDYPKACCHLA